MPARHFSSVLLPDPLRPTMPKKSPCSTWKETSRRATRSSALRRRSGCSARSLSVWTRSAGMRKRLPTFSTRTAGSASARALTTDEASGRARRDPRSLRPLVGEEGGLALQVVRQQARGAVELRERLVEQAQPPDPGDVARLARLAERRRDPPPLVALGDVEVEVLRAVVGLDRELRHPDPRPAS